MTVALLLDATVRTLEGFLRWSTCDVTGGFLRQPG